MNRTAHPASVSWNIIERTLMMLALLGACGFTAVLAIRPLMSADLGYHLSYGDQFWDHGRLVDHNEFLYTMRRYRNTDTRDEVGPGCWYDEQGRYRFPNANWGTQVILSGVYRFTGAYGLCILRLVIILATIALGLVVMRNLSVPWWMIPVGVGLIAMGSYRRFLLRPELFSYLLLVAQLCILTHRGPDPSQKRRSMGWFSVGALVFLQLLLVNVHSYFLLGIALTGAILVDRALHLWWSANQRPRDDQQVRALRGSTLRLGVALVGGVLVCFVNPWTWRVAILPIQTLLYIRKHDLTSSHMDAHPWATIGEFFGPFAERGLLQTKQTYAYFVVLALGLLGFGGWVLRRRWGAALIIAGITTVSLSARRNIAICSMIVVPLALGGLVPWGSHLIKRFSSRLRGAMRIAFSGILVVVFAGLILWVVTQRFYSGDRLGVRFRMGFDELYLARSATQWINRNQPQGRLWCDYNSSSNVHYFTHPHRDVPVVTNTWAHPPAVMAETLDIGRARRPFEQLWKQYAPEILVLRLDSARGLIRRLSRDPKWVVVCVDWQTVVFLRTDGPNSALAARSALSDETFDASNEIRRIENLYPAPGNRLIGTGMTLQGIGFNNASIRLLQSGLDRAPKHVKGWNALGVSLTARGTQRFLANDPNCKEDYERAKECFERSLSIDPDYQIARDNLKHVNVQLGALGVDRDTGGKR